MRIKDHYKTLGVTRNVDESAIRTAFRQLAKKYHPDICGAEETRRFQEIVEAYSVLSDPESRVCYDRIFLEAAGQAGVDVKRRRRAPSGNAPTARSFRPSFFEQRPTFRAEEIFDLLFENLVARGHGRRRFQRQRPLEVEVVLSKEEAGRGGILPLPYPVLAQCQSCGGRGLRGRWICASCNGRGIVEKKETVRIKVPAGVADGSTLEVPTGDYRNPGVVLRIRIRVTNA